MSTPSSPKTYLPRMLTASTLSPFSVSRVMIVCTHSYRIALPAFFAVSVLLATFGKFGLNRSKIVDKQQQGVRG